MKSIYLLVPIVLIMSVYSLASSAEMYRVGPGEKYSRVSEIAERLQPGDVVEVTGDISESVSLSRSGTYEKPITLRGITRVENGCIIRPRVSVPKDARHGIMVSGDWNVIEGLDLSGAVSPDFISGSAITYKGDHLAIRNCRVHHSKQAIFCPYGGKGNLAVEFCEFDSLGGATGIGSNMHGIYIQSTNPEATVTVRFSYFHDGAGNDSVLFKSRAHHNVLAYNWFESPYNGCVRIISTNLPVEGRDKLYPAHSDIVGNVFFQGWSPGMNWSILALGGEDAAAAGIEGDFNIAHNLFLTTNGGESPAVCLLVQGNVDHVKAYNSLFVEYGNRGCVIYLRGTKWDGQRTQEFIKRRGGGEPILVGSNNWISEKSFGVCDAFKNTIRGLNPKFVDLLNGDYRPRKDSPLAGAGLWPLPKGQIVDLVPEYEPQRGIPADLKPRVRRKVIPPSIGPFEVGQ